jgi:hypothetical protein
VHVSYRLLSDLPSARRADILRELCGAFDEGRDAYGGRLAFYGVERHRIHLVLEVSNGEALSRAVHALGIRIARGIDRALARKGKVFADRYEMNVLKTPEEVEAALRELGTAASVMAPRTSLLLNAARAVGSAYSDGGSAVDEE